MWTVETLQNLFDTISRATGLDAAYRFTPAGTAETAETVEISEEVIPDLTVFDQPALSEADRTVMAAYLYADLYLRQQRPNSPADPEVVAKGICDALGQAFIPLRDVEKRLAPARLSDVWRMPSAGKGSDRDPISSEFGIGAVDLRRNLFILSAPSGCGKNTVYEAVKRRMPQVKRVITATTRAPRRGETDGVDYLFCTKERFEEIRLAAGFVEDVCYDHACYGTPVSEVERHDVTIPVFLIVDVRGKERVMRRYPLATSIFISPPSMEELERRLRGRGDNAEAEISRRMDAARMEMTRAKFYEYVVENDDLEACTDRIARVVDRVMGENGR